MSALACFLWWLVLGGLLGLLGSWLLGSLFKRPEPRPIERIVEKPVEKIVEKVVEKPVEKIVEKLVDNPVHLTRIKSLEGEVALIAGLRSQISQFQSAPPKVVEKVVEKIVDRPVEKIVERIVEKIVDRPVEKIVEKIVDRPVEKIVERIVDRPVEKIVTKTVDRVVEKIVDRPVEKIVEKIVEKRVDNPAHLARIAQLEGEVAIIGGLRTQITQLQSAPPKVVEKIVEKIVDRPVEKIVEKIVDRPVEKIVEKVVQDTKGIAERDQKLRDWQVRYDDLERRARNHVETISTHEAELRRLRLAPAIDLAAARAAGFTMKGVDDLEIIEGIGPKIAEVLHADGITTFMQLAQATPEQIRVFLDKAGPNYRLADPGTWPEQAELAARNRWRALKSLQEVLIAGVRADSSHGHEAQMKDLRAQLAEREAEIRRLSAPMPIDLAAAKAAGFTLKGPDDLEIIEGIGPKIAELFYAEGIHTFAALAQMTPAQIQPILDKAGPHFRLADPETWPEQSDLAARNRWRALKSLQDVLNVGKR